MAELETIHLLETLFEHSEFYAGIFLTYGADLAFFEEAILHPLWQNGCRNNLVFMDAQRYADTLGALKDSVTWVGRRYLLIPVDLGMLQSFHPKLVMLIGRERGRLLIGSGNLTFTGFGHNHEVFTCLDWMPGDPDLQHLFAQTWELVREILRQWGHSGEAGTILRKAVHVADWLASPTEPATDIHLLHTLEESLIDQCSRALSGESVDRITVLSPFLDQGASALSALHSRFQPKELHLVLQDERAVGNLESLKGLRQSGAPLEVYRFSGDKRYLHAKVYVFETANASVDPDLAWAIASRGLTYWLRGYYEEALADFNRAIELDPDDDWYFYNRALTYQALGQADESQADLTAAIQYARRGYEKNPQDWANTFDLALYHLVAGEAGGAGRLYREALAGGASSYRIREALYYLGHFLVLFPDHPQACEMRDLLQENLQEVERN